MVLSGIDQRHFPRFGMLLVHSVVRHVESDIKHVQEVEMYSLIR